MSTLLRLCALSAFASAALVAQWHSVGDVDSIAVRGNGVEIRCGAAITRISILLPGIIRVRGAQEGTFLPDRSVAVSRTGWPDIAPRISDSPDLLSLATSEMIVRVRKHPMRLSFHALDGTVLNEDASRGMAWDGKECRVWKRHPSDEFYFGLGEKTGILNRTSKSFILWNSDIPAYRADTDPLYQSVPFFFILRNGRAHGIFFDNTYRSSFDFGVESDQRYAFGASGGEIDYYVFSGPTPSRVLEQYTELVGRMPLPPRWSLGYQQSRWSYSPESKVRALAQTFRQKRIPCDVLYLDIDYMNGYRVFTWSEKNFPRPAEMLADLARSGFKVVTIIDPGIKADSAYDVYRSGLAADAFLRYPEGNIFLGKVWPGMCAFPDFSNPAAREWWGKNFASLIESGVRGFWTDMNEPSVFDAASKTVDPRVVHNDEGLHTLHAKNHNTYGMQMTKATYEGVRQLRPEKRPFILTRASYAGGHRFAAAWTGDNVASWEHLQLAVPMCLGMSISGQPFVGSDIGGFIGSPDGELFARWLQFGAFTPLMRSHTVINSADQEPWSYGPRFEAVNRATIELRYRLLPYIYGVMQQASSTGIPAMRPLIFDYPADSTAIWNDTEFMFGNDILVAPVLWPGDREREVHLPPGVWFDYWTNVRYEGGKEVRVPAPLDRIPLFVKAGAIIPTQQVVQYVEQAPVNPLVLTVYPADSSVSRYYGDDGESFDYLNGEYLSRTFEQIRRTDVIRFRLGRAEGSYPIPRRFVDIRIVGVETAPGMVRVSGRSIVRMRNAPLTEGWSHTSATKILHIRVADTPEEIVIEADRGSAQRRTAGGVR